MSRVVRAGALAAALVAVLLLAYWVMQEDETPQAFEETQIITEPDVYGLDVTFNQLREDGTLHYSLNATEIRQFDKDELTRMTLPQLHLTNPTQPPWDISAEHGYIRKRSNPQGQPEDVVYLREAVQMSQDHPESGLVTLRSPAFYIYPDRQFAETDQDVMIDTSVGRTKAGGMRANLETGLLTLTSSSTQRVHTIVLPDQFKKS